MLEILFTESAAGGLKVARHYGKGLYKPKTVRFLSAADGTPLSRREMEEYRKAAEKCINKPMQPLVDTNQAKAGGLPPAFLLL